METVDEYNLADQFHKDVKDPLLEIPSSHSKELWLIQWPDEQDPGQKVSIELNHDGQLAIFESSSGISYEMVSYASQEPDATVFLSSASEAKIAGKVSRRVSLVRYPKLSELDEKAKRAKTDLFARKSSRTRGTFTTALTPSKSTGGKRGTSPAFGGISRGTLGDPSKKKKKKKKKTKEETE